MEDKRFLPLAPLPRQYPFLTRHSAKSFLTYTTYDFSAGDFDRRLTVPHGLPYEPMHDMWFAKLLSVTGDPVKDYRADVEPVIHTPLEMYDDGGFGGLMDSYVCNVGDGNVYIDIKHRGAGSGTYHCYFHVKLYRDQFDDVIFDGTRSSFTV